MKKYILPLILILCFTYILTGHCWVAGYDQRVKLTIDQTKIDTADLENFPVTAFFTAAQAEEIFAEFDADEDFDRGQFALGDDTLLYAEKELFDDSESLGIYHTKIPLVYFDADTDYYFYYDNDADHNTDYIGAINTAAGAAVWDGNFEAVYHMVDATTSTVVDSTSNNNDGTKKGANEPIEATGQVGQGQDFDGADDYIGITDIAALAGTQTIEATVRSTFSAGMNQYIWDEGGNVYQIQLYDVDDSDGKPLVAFNGHLFTGATELQNTNTWYQITCTADGTSLVSYVNGSQDGTTTGTEQTPANITLGCYGGSGQFFDGIIDEVRVSSSVRTAAWIKATYNTLWDTLLTYGSEEIGGVTANAIMFGFAF